MAARTFEWIRAHLPQSGSPPPDLIDPEDPSNWIGIDFVFEQVSDQLALQQKLWEEADGRLRLVLGVISIVFAVTLGLIPRGTVTLQSPDGRFFNEPLYLPFWVGALAIIGLLLFAGAGVIAIIAYWPRDFSWPPAPDSTRAYILVGEREIKLTVLDALLEAYVVNDLAIGMKFRAVRRALIVTAIATAALGASIIIELAQLTRSLS